MPPTSKLILPQQAPFEVISEYSPSGDQPQAIREMVKRINDGEQDIVLLGSGGLALERAGVAGVAIRGSAAARRATGTGPA